ncbi:GatB/YqeY domain-containing protein [Denitromonas iodatirespirans]|uniref:GatB/YqeY domain-containing protein n=1 Tax=Denitromonas iodatirespirans TaxID=2795389 RepID=A0A944HBV3_DENI1|nr:GatB/YqeY domain-containing protein [Denitromonas iodatirespirans]MBT0962047.1 GatB/YqeY domain-containing protein [Denitromonas iodatirespirans]
MSLKARLQDDMKAAMRARDTARLSAIRFLLAAIQQKEVDGQTALDDAGVAAVIEKQLKQRRDSATQYAAGGRADLEAQERFEISVLEAYMPAGLSDAEIDAAVAKAIADTGAASPADMGKVMAQLKPALAGRADMAAVSARVKAALNAAPPAP